MLRQTQAYLLHRTGGVAVLLWHALYVQGTSALRTYKCCRAKPSDPTKQRLSCVHWSTTSLIACFGLKPQKGIGSSSAPRPAFSICAGTPACIICHCIIPRFSPADQPGACVYICIMLPPKSSKSLLLIYVKIPCSAIAAQPHMFCQPNYTSCRGARQCLMHLSTACAQAAL